MAISDTSPRFARLHLELYRAAGAARRVHVAVDLSEAVRATALAGIRSRHPNYSEEEIRSTFLRHIYGGGRSS